MKIFLTVILGIGLVAGSVYAGEQIKVESKKEKLSYSMGYDIGSRLKKESIDIDAGILSRGIQDGFAGSKTLITKEEMKQSLTAFQKELVAKQKEMTRLLSEKNKKEGEAFLAENSKKEGVVTLPSGLQYKVIKEGTGAKPKITDTVSVQYRGTLIDGTEFDSSYKRGKPAVFPLQGIIPGWTEALQLMKEGAKWQLFIPSGLAYGERAIGNKIGPNSTLIFEVELISIQKEG